MQHGPGTENAYGGIAQAFGDSIPILVVPRRLSAPHRPRRRQLQRDRADARHHQIGRAGHLAGRSRQRDAARLLAPAQRPRRSGAGRGARRSLERGSAGAARLQAGRRDRAFGPDPERVARGGADAGRGQAAGHLCGPGRALGPGLEAAARSSPSFSARRSPPASKARARSRRTIRSRSARAASRCPRRCATSSTRPT